MRIAFLVLLIFAGALVWITLRARSERDSPPFPDSKDYPFKYDEVTDELRAAAAKGDADAQFELGVWLAADADDPTAPGEFSDLIIAAADAGHTAAESELGTAYLEGKWGLERDPARAVEWFNRAASKGDEIAGYQLGVCYRDGLGVARNDVKSVMHFLASAELGYAASQFSVHLAFREGVGVEQESVTARRAATAAKRQHYSHREFVDDNLVDAAGQRLAGANSGIQRHSRPGREYAQAVRCAALKDALADIGPIKSTNVPPLLDPEKAEQVMREGGFALKGEIEREAAKFSLLRLAALLGDPVAQNLYADRLGGAVPDAQIAEVSYWRVRSARNPLRDIFDDNCS